MVSVGRQTNYDLPRGDGNQALNYCCFQRAFEGLPGFIQTRSLSSGLYKILKLGQYRYLHEEYTGIKRVSSSQELLINALIN